MKNTFHYSYKQSYFLVAICQADDTGYFCTPFHLDEKLYLSAKKRKCGLNKAAEFDSRKKAVSFFDQWFHKQQNKNWKLEIVDLQRNESVELELFDQSHPLWKLYQEVSSSSIKYAEAYFNDFLREIDYSKSTLNKYRKIFLPFGFDINERVEDEWNLSLIRKIKIEEIRNSPAYQSFNSKTKKTALEIIK